MTIKNEESVNTAENKTRTLSGPLGIIFTIVASLFTLTYIYIAKFGVPNPQLNRGLYLGFTFVLCFMLYPATKKSPRHRLSIIDYLFLAASVAVIVYFIVEYPKMTFRAGEVTQTDIIFSIMAIIVTLEVTRRVLGNTLPIIAIVFLIYAYFGPYMPSIIAHRGFSIERIATYQFTTLFGIFGIVTSIFAKYVFLFIIFGTFLDKLGAAKFFIDLPYALTGRTRGGPAKAAVLVSGLMGSVSGSAVANVITTGTFTIPLMKKTGYKPHVAAGVETAASSGGQMVPPIMGAGAFLIAEFAGVPYWDIVKISIIPALLYFGSVLWLVDLEAARTGLRGLSKNDLPNIKEVIKSGWFFVLPLAAIILLLMQGYSPSQAGFWAIVTTVAVGMINKSTRISWREFVKLLRDAAVKSLTIGASAGTIGIIIGIVYLTGLGLKFSDLVVSLSGGMLPIAIILVGLASYVLGMGLTVTSSYIILAILAVPALTKLGVPLVASHLIVFWFSQDANITPPVCLAAFAAAGIAGADPMKTGWTSFKFGKGLYLMPFLFAYTPILLNGTVTEIIITFISVSLGIIAAGPALQGYFITDTGLLERIILGGAAFLLFHPALTTDGIGLALLTAVFLKQMLTRKKVVEIEA
ncbi:TRAP transporter permease [Calderihabitans maritimus]|uniref:TRAP transporter, 4TM/12TM fusion protein n=1 Tax=Calderihabitans maritimus TaxID=1246530 RepID=A0A1Z5HPX9_9FIRM|nr:TRAP transporter permease [Calderihabitans maritimus]GAW91589.1 TRAP transporter, 4TM/12TM fusion protein [Calderihabitans maritimus]